MIDLLLALTLTTALQNPPPPPTNPAPPAAVNTVNTVNKELATALATAIRALDAGKGAYFVGDVDERKPPAEASAHEGGARMVFGGPGMDAGEPFKGAIEVLITDKKELLIASMRAVPEVVVFDDGTHQLVRTTVEDQSVSTERLTTDLVSMLDLARLATQVEKATKLEGGEPATDGARSIDCELSPRSVRLPNKGMMGMMQPKVLAVRARFDLDGKGVITGMELSVTRSDPMAAMRRNALEQAGEPGTGGSGGERIVRFGGAPDTGSDEEGPTSVYKLRTRNEVPTAHARDSLTAMRKLTEAKR